MTTLNLVFKETPADTALVFGAGTATAVSNDFVANYKLLDTTTKDLTASYILRSTISNDLVSGYSVNSTVSNDLAGIYGITSSITKDIVSTYKLLNISQKDLTVSYTLIDSTAVQNDITASYTITGKATSDLVASYGIIGTTISNLVSTYAIAGSSISDLVSTYTITTPTTAEVLGNTTGYIHYRVTASESGHTSAVSPIYTVRFVNEGYEALSVVIDNPNVIVPFTSDGSTLVDNPVPSSSCNISVLRGSTFIPYNAGPGSFYIVSRDIVGGSITAAGPVNNGTYATYSNITGMTGDIVEVTFGIQVYDDAGNPMSNLYYAKQTFSKSATGGTGSAVYIHSINPEIIYLPTDSSGNVTSYANAISKYTVTLGTEDKTTVWSLTKQESNVNSTLSASGNLQITKFGNITSELARSPSTSDTLYGNSRTYYYGNYLFIFSDRYLTGSIESTDATSYIFRRNIYTITADWEPIPFPINYQAVVSAHYSTNLQKLFLVVKVYSGSVRRFMSSDLGDNWTEITNAINSNLFYQVSGDSTYVYADNIQVGQPPSVKRSTNGTTWFTYSTDVEHVTGRVVEGNSVLLSLDGNQLYRATTNTFNYTTWTAVSVSGSVPITDCLFFNGYFYAVSSTYINDSRTDVYVYKSLNGSTGTWSILGYLQTPGPCGYLHVINGRAVLSGGLASNISYPYQTLLYVSDDFITWTQMQLAITPNVMGNPSPIPMSSNYGTFYALSWGSTVIPRNLVDESGVYNTTQTINYVPMILVESGDNISADPDYTARQYNISISSNIDIQGYVDITATKSPDPSVTKRVLVYKGTTNNTQIVSRISPNTTIYPATSAGTVTDYSQTSSMNIFVTENGQDTTSTWAVTSTLKSPTSIQVSGTYPNFSINAGATPGIPDATDTGYVEWTLTKTGKLTQVVKWTYSKDKSTISDLVLPYNFFTPISSPNYIGLQLNLNGWCYTKNSSGANWVAIAPWSTAPGTFNLVNYYVKVVVKSGSNPTQSTGSLGDYISLAATPNWILSSGGLTTTIWVYIKPTFGSAEPNTVAELTLST